MYLLKGLEAPSGLKQHYYTEQITTYTIMSHHLNETTKIYFITFLFLYLTLLFSLLTISFWSWTEREETDSLSIQPPDPETYCFGQPLEQTAQASATSPEKGVCAVHSYYY